MGQTPSKNSKKIQKREDSEEDSRPPPGGKVQSRRSSDLSWPDSASSAVRTELVAVNGVLVKGSWAPTFERILSL